jgi:electron transfer flavoprotein beta subunit
VPIRQLGAPHGYRAGHRSPVPQRAVNRDPRFFGCRRTVACAQWPASYTAGGFTSARPSHTPGRADWMDRAINGARMPLKILVTAKRVEDPESKIRVKPDGSAIVTDGVNYKLNPFDEVAIEEALRLQTKHGAEVVVVSIGGAASQTELRAALAMGADRAILVRHDGALDPVLVSALLAKVAASEKPDLVLLGKQSIDDDQAQAGPYLAERLGWPQATFASKTESLESEVEQKRVPGLALSTDGKELTVLREVDGGVERLALELPAVVTAELRLNKPRFASLPGIMKAKKKPLQEIAAASLGVDLAPAVVIRRLSEPPARKGGVKVADLDELWAKLHEEAKVV